MDSEWTPQLKSSTGNTAEAGEFDVGVFDEAVFDLELTDSPWTPQSKGDTNFTAQTKN